MLLLILFLKANRRRKLYSNTSHVTINHRRRGYYFFLSPIQIHLMLLLIMWILQVRWRGMIQIHLMLLLITDRSPKSRPCKFIQIHLMLLLIPTNG